MRLLYLLLNFIYCTWLPAFLDLSYCCVAVLLFQQALLRDLLIASEDKMQLMGGPEFVYIIAALAKLRAAPDQAWLNRWLAVSRHKLNLLGPSQLVMCTRALCRLDMQPG